VGSWFKEDLYMAKEIRLQGLRVVGPLFDGSGYGSGARNWVKGLFKRGVPMWVHPVSFEKDRPEMKEEFELIDALARTPRQCDVNFVRLSPEIAVDFLEPNLVNICSCAWETSKLHPHWVDCCNRFDSIFVESEWSRAVFINSGVKVPIMVVPNCIDVSRYTPKERVNTGTYQFYSVQQWTERKNGIGLLKAYYNAFKPGDDVVLVLKTYITRMEEKQDQASVIKGHIDVLKKSMNLGEYPPVYLVTEKLSVEEMRQLHEQCDCYVLLDRGEGLGLPFMDAAAAANPIIATDYAGSRQFLDNKNSYAVPYQLTYVENMMWSPFYQGNQLWAEPNLPAASDIMRSVFENRDDAFNLGKKAREDMKTKFNEDVITKTLLGAIASAVESKRK
jgi:glycosyltransferase involved in cell wall biosynthesis